VFEFLSRTETQLVLGQYSSDIFEKNRRYVDQELANYCPDALQMFSAAYRRLQEGDIEARSQALTSCRRILKELADRLYPPSAEKVEGIDGRSRKLTDAQFVARLWQFIYEQLRKSASGKVLEAAVDSLGKRIDSLNELSSKGVHDVVSQEETEQCVIHTYLVTGDLLRLASNQSALQKVAAEADEEP
jgi:TusA-related sulfurtransferase